MSQSHISCAMHDYIEIACMQGYRVRLALKNGRLLEGKARDVVTKADKREFLVIDNGHTTEIELIQLAKLTTLTPNAAFKTVTFRRGHISETQNMEQT